jgi:hypothetical protein
MAMMMTAIRDFGHLLSVGGSVPYCGELWLFPIWVSGYAVRLLLFS